MNKIVKNLYLPFSLLLIAAAIYVKFLDFRSDESWGTLKSFAVGN